MNTDEEHPEEIEPDINDPRIQAALAELRGLILQRYPAATFITYEGEDPVGIYLTPIVDVEDLDEVAEVFTDRLLDMQVEEGLPVYVVPDLPLERVAERAAAHRNQKVPLSQENLMALFG